MEIPAMIEGLKSDVLGKLGQFTTDLDGVKENFTKLQLQVDAIDMQGRDRFHGGPEQKSIGQLVIEHPNFAAYKASDFRGQPCRIPLGRGAFDLKSTISNSGLGTGTT